MCPTSTFQSLFSRPAFVYAHSDDAALSASALMMGDFQAKLDILVCGALPQSNVLSSWDKRSGFSNSTSAMKTRLDEHDRFRSAARVDGQQLEVKDRAYGEDCNAWNLATAQLLQSATLFNADVVVTHCTRARHKDHIRTVEMVHHVAEALDIPVVYTCDRPYFACTLSCENTLANNVRLDDDTWAAKEVLVDIYASQHLALRDEFGDTWRSRERLGFECWEIARP